MKNKKCIMLGCENPATHYDPIDKDLICKTHLDFLRSCGVKTVYRSITEEKVVQECQK